MIALAVDPEGRQPRPFSYPDVPRPVPVGKCQKCGGNTRVEEYESWTAATGKVLRRNYRCIRNPGRCPVITETINEETPMPKPITITQTADWCAKVKGQAKRKGLSYAQLGAMIGATEDAVRNYLNRKTDMDAATRAALVEGIAAHVSEYVGEKLAPNLRLALQDLKKAVGLQRLVELMGESGTKVTVRMLEDGIAGKGQQEPALNAVETGLAFLEKYPPPGVFTGTTQCVGVLNPELPASLDIYLAECAREDAEAYVAMLQSEPGPDGLIRYDEAAPLPGLIPASSAPTVEARMRDLEQRHKALECKVAGVAERTERRICEVENEHHGAVVALEDRLTQTYEHLTEHMAGLQPLVVSERAEAADALDEWLATRPAIQMYQDRVGPDALLTELALMSEVQVQALVTAAAARRNFFKALEAA